MAKKTTRTISDFFNNEYRNYSLSVVEDRAIPSVIDGLKPTARKVVFVADKIWKGTSSDKPVKVFQLTGRVAADAMYAHGDASLNSVITGMGQKFKNNLPLLDGVGQYGSLRSPFAGAPRYIGTKLSSNFRLVYKDFELLEGKIEEGVEVEPNFYLPIIPMVLVNGTSGMAVGFATNILNRNPVAVIDECLNFLNGKKVKDVAPWLSEFSGTWTQDIDNINKWTIKGSYEVVNTTTVKITELPPSWTFEKYEEHLNSLIDKKIIVDYDDKSSSKVDYTLKFQRAILADLIKKDKLENVLKICTSDTENLTTLDENGKLKIFNTISELISYFTEYRLSWYDKRKQYIISQLEKDLLVLSNKARFIKAIIDKKLKVNNVPKKEVIEWLDKNKFDMLNSSYDYLINMPIYSLTKERYEELLKQKESKTIELDTAKNLVTRHMYITDLKELKKKIS